MYVLLRKVLRKKLALNSALSQYPVFERLFSQNVKDLPNELLTTDPRLDFRRDFGDGDISVSRVITRVIAPLEGLFVVPTF
jgi:hypothetical protein